MGPHGKVRVTNLKVIASSVDLTDETHTVLAFYLPYFLALFNFLGGRGLVKSFGNRLGRGFKPLVLFFSPKFEHRAHDGRGIQLLSRLLFGIKDIDLSVDVIARVLENPLGLCEDELCAIFVFRFTAKLLVFFESGHFYLNCY